VLNRLLQLNDDEARLGVAVMSAGNHAQGVAFHARRLGVPALIVMPESTPLTKVEQTKAHGAEVLPLNGGPEDCAAGALRIAAEREMTFIHPYDDPPVIAGKGTVALEMIEAQPKLDRIIAPVGGDGLISGMAIATRALAPHMRMVGVQTESHAAMATAYHGVNASVHGPTIADGTAVKALGQLHDAARRGHPPSHRARIRARGIPAPHLASLLVPVLRRRDGHGLAFIRHHDERRRRAETRLGPALGAKTKFNANSRAQLVLRAVMAGTIWSDPSR
jgi:hypothetical protein